MAGIRITITGAQGSGKTRFLDRVLIPALKISGIPFAVDDCGNYPGTYGEGDPEIDILVTHREGVAIKHILAGDLS